MPYIIERWSPLRSLNDPVRYASHAVATLDEARTAALAEVELGGHGVADLAILRAADTLPESGGALTLPDGTVIEIRPTDWLELAGLAGWKLDWATRDRLTGRTRAADRDALLAAYNARVPS